ncbi:hypothetical protein BD779DRAFT_1795983 [Infundibulicybe gibba]|nr:hypothetical protein BD779DRAFT_1795983 [Infundibulicybe gibba]
MSVRHPASDSAERHRQKHRRPFYHSTTTTPSSTQPSTPPSSSSEYSDSERETRKPKSPKSKQSKSRRRSSVPVQGNADRRRLAVVQMDSVAENKTYSDPGHGEDKAAATPKSTIRSRRGHEQNLAGIALVAPPDAAVDTYTQLTPPPAQPTPEPKTPKHHYRGASESTGQKKSPRDVGIVGTQPPSPTLKLIPELAKAPGHTPAASIAPANTSTSSLHPHPIFQQPHSRSPSPNPDTARHTRTPATNTPDIPRTPSPSKHTRTPSPMQPLHAYPDVSQLLHYQPALHAKAGPLPPPPRAMFNIDINSPPPPRPPRMHSPLPPPPPTPAFLQQQGTIAPLRPRGDIEAVRQALQLPPAVEAALAGRGVGKPDPKAGGNPKPNGSATGDAGPGDSAMVSAAVEANPSTGIPAIASIAVLNTSTPASAPETQHDPDMSVVSPASPLLLHAAKSVHRREGAFPPSVLIPTHDPRTGSPPLPTKDRVKERSRSPPPPAKDSPREFRSRSPPPPAKDEYTFVDVVRARSPPLPAKDEGDYAPVILGEPRKLEDVVEDEGDVDDGVPVVTVIQPPPRLESLPGVGAENNAGTEAQPNAVERDEHWVNISREFSPSPEFRGPKSLDHHRTGSRSRSPSRDDTGAGTPSPPPKSFRNSLTTNLKRFSSLPRTPSSSSRSAKRLSAGSSTQYSPTPPSPLALPPSPGPAPVSQGSAQRVKIRSQYPAAMFCSEVLSRRSALERCAIYAHKINELYMHDCGLGDWVLEARFRDKASNLDRVRTFLRRLYSTTSPHITFLDGIRSNFPPAPGRLYRYRPCRTLHARPLPHYRSPDAALPLPRPAQRTQQFPPRSSTSLGSSTPTSSIRSLTPATPASKTGGFFASLGRKASMSKRDRVGPTVPAPASSVSPGGRLLLKSPTALHAAPVPSVRPINLAPSVPGGPRAPPNRMLRSQTLMTPASPFSPTSPGGVDRHDTITRRPSLFNLSGDRVLDIQPDPEFTRQVDKLADLLPHADRTVLAGYLRRAGQDIMAIGQYLEDEKNGTIKPFD